MPIDLYHSLERPLSGSVVMCVKQLSLDVNIKTIDIKSGDHLTPEYEKLNPYQTVPTLVDDGLVLWDSRTILRYLVNAYALNSSLYPSEPKRRAIVDEWLDFSYALHESYKHAIGYKVVKGIEPTVQQMAAYKKMMSVLDTAIAETGFVAGDELTIVDLSVMATLHPICRFVGHELNGYPHSRQWFERMKKSLPYYYEFFG